MLVQNPHVAKRFEESAGVQPATVESVIQLSEKYKKLADEKAALLREKETLQAEKQRLEQELAATQQQLEQTKKELAEANDLLIEMRIELNNWKTNVLGFRDEMRQAQKAQLEALLKILKVLGGEIGSETTAEETSAEDTSGSSTVASSPATTSEPASQENSNG